MSKLDNLVPIFDDLPEADPAEFTISVGPSELRLRTGRNGRVSMIGPGTLMNFPASDCAQPLAMSGLPSDRCPDHPQWPTGEAIHMKVFCIDRNHHIALLTPKSARAGTEANICFTSEAELAGLVREWPGSRLVAAWNALPGVAAVRKFTSREVAISRIWGALQKLRPPRIAPRKKPVGDGAPSKKDQVLALLQTATGATVAQLMEATGWQKHTIRAFLSRTVHKNLGLPLRTSRSATGERVYRIAR